MDKTALLSALLIILRVIVSYPEDVAVALIPPATRNPIEEEDPSCTLPL
jgi:hypothetical protein